jgi:hypothetical protein
MLAEHREILQSKGVWGLCWQPVHLLSLPGVWIGNMLTDAALHPPPPHIATWLNTFVKSRIVSMVIIVSGIVVCCLEMNKGQNWL